LFRVHHLRSVAPAAKTSAMMELAHHTRGDAGHPTGECGGTIFPVGEFRVASENIGGKLNLLNKSLEHAVRGKWWRFEWESLPC